MQTIGIIGGGQLGMYISLAAIQLGYKTHVYDEKDNVSAKYQCDEFTLGSFNDQVKLEEFCKQCDVITYEFENINSDIIDALSTKYNIVQTSKPLKISSSRIKEKELCKELDIKTIQWQLVDNNPEDIKIDYPYLLKTISLGYDGKGQYKINKKEDLKQVDFKNYKYICEKLLPFDYEISLIAIKSEKELAIYDPFYNIHHKGILNITLINQDIPQTVINQAQDIIKKIIKHENILGILTVEFFVKDNIVYFNEIAPRPHNSGHITMDTHITSQYHNLVKAITNQPLGSTKIKCDGMMINVLGQDIEKLKDIQKKFNTINYYSYRKEPRENRKIGHIIDYDTNHLTYYKNNFR